MSETLDEIRFIIYGWRKSSEKPGKCPPLKVVCGNTTISEEEKKKGLELFRSEVMKRLNLPFDMSWSSFFERSQEKINLSGIKT